jgi:hypothetical protein
LPGRTALVFLLISTVLASAFVGGIAVFYGGGLREAPTVTHTTTVTSYNTIVQIVTSTPETAPSTVMLYGTIQSEINYPVEVDFCKYTSEVIPISNNISQESQLNGAACGSFSATVTNQTKENFGPNDSYFVGNYSVALPNNATYLLQVRLLQSSAGPDFEEQAGWLPLNYTSSTRISGYGIVCYQFLVSAYTTVQCSSGFG